MNISIKDIDRDNFLVHEHEIAGEICYLVQPTHIGARWSRDTMHFRSSLWNSKGELISASFKKFFNWGEQPELVATPSNLNDCFLMEKLDGSTLIVSRYKGQTIARTRGTVDATKLDNGHEIEKLKKKYPKVFDFTGVDTYGYSMIYEWVSPENKIVLDYGPEPDLYLTAIIDHENYRLLSQFHLDVSAADLGVKRPKKYNFSTVQDMLKVVEEMQGQEGICVYFGDGQEIRKVKSAQYLALHRFKSNATLENTIDLYFELNRPSYIDFERQLIEKFDFECFQMVRGYASNIVDAMKEVLFIIDGFNATAFKLHGMSRKDIASYVLQAYGPTNRASFVFNIIDGKVLDNDKIKKLLYQVLKK